MDVPARLEEAELRGVLLGVQADRWSVVCCIDGDAQNLHRGYIASGEPNTGGCMRIGAAETLRALMQRSETWIEEQGLL